MNTADYWPMAIKYSIWNAAVAALQFWTADPKAHVLSSTIEQVYNVFFYSTSTHLLCQQSDEILFGCFVTTLNAAFESKLALEDKCYESSSENFNIPTPLKRTSKIHHVSSVKNASFEPDPVTLHSTGTKQSHCRPVHRCLTYSSFEDDDTPTDETPYPDSTPQVQYHIDAFQQPSSKYTLNAYGNLEEEDKEEEEEDKEEEEEEKEVKEEEEEYFPTVSLDDDHWNMEEIPDRHLCIHEHSILHELCPHPCPYLDYTTSSYYNTLDLSDISKFEDLMTNSSNEDIPALDVVRYWNLWTMVRNEHLCLYELLYFSI